jgi:hypothetical protein
MLVVAVVAVLLLCVGGAWVARNSLSTPLIHPDATDVTITPRGLHNLNITYHVPGLPYAWRAELAKRLTTSGWQAREYTFSGTRAPFIVTWYTNEIVFGPFQLVEHAVVGGDPDDPNVVYIQAHRELHFRR